MNSDMEEQCKALSVDFDQLYAHIRSLWRSNQNACGITLSRGELEVIMRSLEIAGEL